MIHFSFNDAFWINTNLLQEKKKNQRKDTLDSVLYPLRTNLVLLKGNCVVNVFFTT